MERGDIEGYTGTLASLKASDLHREWAHAWGSNATQNRPR